ncbi:LamB/YcsF family protein [Symbiobacterium thermophilum]|uniref:LamB/YcsF family protein n=1 Tax=Symbiobacterium thermophilum TaxID=2734 RepID=UPI0035C6C331
MGAIRGPVRKIDLNCDMGESFGVYRIGADEEIMPLITSANIACGFHGGDPQVMRRTVRLAREHGVAVGAHPGYRDLVGFGRRPVRCSPDEVYADVLYQIGALAAFCRAEGVALRHVKPHGALYNTAAADAAIAGAVARAVADFDRSLMLYAPPGSALEQAGLAAGLRVIREGFADRGYAADGTLLPRTHPGAVLHEPERAAAQARRMVCSGTVTADTGEDLAVPAETLCVHGDHPSVIQVLRRIRSELEAAGVSVGAPGAD